MSFVAESNVFLFPPFTFGSRQKLALGFANPLHLHAWHSYTDVYNGTRACEEAKGGVFKLGATSVGRRRRKKKKKNNNNNTSFQLIEYLRASKSSLHLALAAVDAGFSEAQHTSSLHLLIPSPTRPFLVQHTHGAHLVTSPCDRGKRQRTSSPRNRHSGLQDDERGK